MFIVPYSRNIDYTNTFTENFWVCGKFCGLRQIPNSRKIKDITGQLHFYAIQTSSWNITSLWLMESVARGGHRYYYYIACICRCCTLTGFNHAVSAIYVYYIVTLYMQLATYRLDRYFICPPHAYIMCKLHIW